MGGWAAAVVVMVVVVVVQVKAAGTLPWSHPTPAPLFTSFHILLSRVPFHLSGPSFSSPFSLSSQPPPPSPRSDA